jgi:hypothetical protein
MRKKKAESRRQKAVNGGELKPNRLLLTAFCLPPSAFCLLHYNV